MAVYAPRVTVLERSASVRASLEGEASGTTNGSGEFSVTFPVEFAAAPAVVVTARTSLDRFAVVRSTSTTGFTVAYYDLSAAGVAASVSIIVAWRAFTV